MMNTSKCDLFRCDKFAQKVEDSECWTGQSVFVYVIQLNESVKFESSPSCCGV